MSVARKDQSLPINGEAKAAECAALQRLRQVQGAAKFAPAFGVRRIPPLLLRRSLASRDLAPHRCPWVAERSEPPHVGCYHVMTANVAPARLLSLDALR